MNLLKNLPEQIENGSAAEKDALARLLLLNSHIDAQNQAYFEWKEPFNTLLIAAKAVRKKEGSSSYDKPSSTMGCSGEPGEARTLDTGLKRPVL